MAKKHPNAEAALYFVGAPEGSATPTTADNSRRIADKVSDTPTKTDLVRVTARIAEWQKDRLEQIAKEEGRLLSELIREAIRDYLKHH